MTSERRRVIETGETLDQVLRRIADLHAAELGALLEFVRLDPAVGASDDELLPLGGRATVIVALVAKLRTIARADAAGAQPSRFKASCHCVWCARRRPTPLLTGSR